MAGKRGKQINQKMKPYLIYRFLMEKSDEQHPIRVSEIIDFLKGYEIEAERKSIYSDIEEINKAIYCLDKDITIEEASDILQEKQYFKTIAYDEHNKGYYVNNAHYDIDTIRLLAESVYSAKFLTTNRANELIDVVCNLVSENQAKEIKHQVFLVDRVKTENTKVPLNLSYINESMSTKDLDGNKKDPTKISFDYLRYQIREMSHSAKPKKTRSFTVSPYYLIINDGNYYLLAVVDKHILTFRVDRMDNVKVLDEPRDGKEVISSIKIADFAQTHFSMFSGDEYRVHMVFENSLLDTVVEQFGTKNVFYISTDDNHFEVSTNVGVSSQFFSWITGFGKRARITEPAEVVKQYTDYLDEIRSSY